MPAVLRAAGECGVRVGSGSPAHAIRLSGAVEEIAPDTQVRPGSLGRMTERTTGDSGDDTGENSPGQDPWRDLGITPESDEPFFDEASFDEPSFDELLFPGADSSTVNPQIPVPAVPTGKRPKAPKLRRGASSESPDIGP